MLDTELQIVRGLEDTEPLAVELATDPNFIRLIERAGSVEKAIEMLLSEANETLSRESSAMIASMN